MRLLLVASSGGHLQHLLWLAPWWRAHERTWVTFDTPDAIAALQGERVVWAAHPTNRNLPNLLRNAVLAARVVRAERPDVVVSPGAGLALPFLGVAAALGVPTVFLEVYDRVERPSLTGRLLAPVVDVVVLQHEAQRAAYPAGVVLGAIR